MKLLDLYCGAGGAAMGYHRAGFEVTGVDIKPQPNYPFKFIQADVFSLEPEFIDGFDIIHASPPCQAYSRGTIGYRNKGKTYPDLLSKTREILIKTNKEYIIENVVGAKLLNPLKLCGTMFNMRIIRHRLFEINANTWVYPPCGCKHNGTVYNGDYVMLFQSGVGSYGLTKEQRKEYQARYTQRITKLYNKNKSDAQYLDWCDAMDINWMNKYPTLTKNKYDLTQAIPPAYTEWIGKLIINQ